MTTEFVGPPRQVTNTPQRDQAFCLTGGPYGQAIERLRPGFWYDDCGFLDAPDYLPIGGARNVVYGPYAAVLVSDRRAS